MPTAMEVDLNECPALLHTWLGITSGQSAARKSPAIWRRMGFAICSLTMLRNSGANHTNQWRRKSFIGEPAVPGGEPSAIIHHPLGYRPRKRPPAAFKSARGAMIDRIRTLQRIPQACRKVAVP